jgi:glycogen operon protein
VRHFIKGDAGYAPEMYRRISGSEDLYDERTPEASVNFITCHDGFTLYDLVSYNKKHNEANGEDNRDGSDDNASWNCGAEGETKDPEIHRLRLRQMMNATSLLLTSRGVPMLLSGDEFANTQYGNNNAYCQDNEISWLDWDRLAQYRELFAFTKNMIAFRKAHPVLRIDRYENCYNATGYPELSFHSLKPWELDPNAPNLCFAYLYAEDHIKFRTPADTFLYICVNAHWEAHDFALPLIPDAHHWRIAADTYAGVAYVPGEEIPFNSLTQITLQPRSVTILISRTT